MTTGHSTALGLAMLVAACAGIGAAQPAAAPRFDSTRAYGHLRDMVEIGPRVSGTPANLKTRQYLISTLAAILSAEDFTAMVGHLSLVHAAAEVLHIWPRRRLLRVRSW